MTEDRKKASEEQLAYAGVLNIGMWIGLALLVVTFILYISGVLPSYVPIEKLSEIPQGSNVPYWGMRAHEFNQAFNVPTGWGWTSLVAKGDYLNFVGIAMLGGLSILCYLVILPILIRKKDTAYVAIAILEVLVLALAASGILKAGGH
ncbi:MAG: hypothetical protein Q7T83_07450 [Thermodesulfovibrionales bacterium]|nr:hypothetical protein [Thermodesulfovibrionales bacterium]MDP3110871.1 hypothetical protein [Thermodesulfovibrionales bacterium]